MVRLVVLALIFPGAVALFSAPGSEPNPEVRIPRAPKPPRIESYLTPGDHPYETEISDFRQRQPGDGQRSSQATTVYLSYDDRNIYAVFVCREDPARVRAHLSRRESISDDDKVGIAIDTFHDRRRAYVFYANPLGVQLDGIITEGQADDYQFDTVWRSEGRLFESGYAVLFAIPFRSLRFARAGNTWGIALTRQIRRLKEYSSWPYITDRIEAYVPQFARLTGIDIARSNRNVEVAPYAASAWQHERDAEGSRRARDRRAGVDAKMVFHDAVTLDVTVNPDFSQIESDEPQVTVNRRYEVYVPERRPFFLENAGLFETPETLFFSRRIVDPTFGARLSGKIGSWAMGALVADDRAPGLLDGTGERAHIRVARLQRELPQGSTVGALFTERERNGAWNRVASVDARLKLNPNLVFTGQTIRSTDRFDGRTTSGNASFAELRFTGRNANYVSSYRDRSPEFHSAVGYIPRADVRQVSNSAGYDWRPEEGVLASFGPSVRGAATWNHAGRLQDWFAEVPFHVELRRATTVVASRWHAFELYRGATVRSHANTLYASSDFVQWMGFTAFVSRGTGVNYNPAAGVHPSSARSTDASLELTIRPSARLRIDQSYFYTKLGGASAPIFTNHLTRSKVHYQFSRALSIRAILDYNGLIVNPALSSMDPEKRLACDLLLTYLVHPGTALYVGVATAARDLAHDTMSGFPPGFSNRQSRQIFAKLTYRLRL